MQEVFRGTSRAYWTAKILRNVERDRRTDAQLRTLKWGVVRVWEKDVLRDLNGQVAKIERALRTSQKRQSRERLT